MSDPEDKRFFLNHWRVDVDLMVAVCDAEILGSVFVEGKYRLDVNKNFYGGKLVSLVEAISYLESASIANLVGVNIVKHAVEVGIIHKDAVIYVDGQPHAQLIKIL